MKHQLYYYPANASLAPHILLEEAGCDFELVLVDRKLERQKSVEYLRLNPNGRIPVLVSGELVLFESAAICLYIADLFPEARLVPVKDPAGVSPDRAMTALPVQLDPGPEPPLPPAGWTPLRLGLVLAWVVLPVSTLSETGAATVPPAVVVIPWADYAPMWLLAAILLVATVAVVVRTIRAVRISSVLRARDG